MNTEKNKNKEKLAIAVDASKIPDFFSSGLVSGWLGALTNAHGQIEVTTPELAASAASNQDNPAILLLRRETFEVSNVLPWFSVHEIVFPNDDIAEEFSMRAYKNFDPSFLKISSRSEIFTETKKVDALQEIKEKPAQWELANKLGGAVATISQVPLLPSSSNCPGIEATRNEIIKQLLSNMEEITDSKKISQTLSPLTSSDSKDIALLNSVVEKIAVMDPSNNFAPLKFLREIKEIYSASDQLIEYIEEVEDIITATIDLPIFHHGTGLTSIKALVLFLLDELPEVSIDRLEETITDPNTVILAACFSGLRTGWKRLPMEMRFNELLCKKIESSLANSCDITATRSWGSDLPDLRGVIFNLSDDRKTLIGLAEAEETSTWTPHKLLIARTLEVLDYEAVLPGNVLLSEVTEQDDVQTLEVELSADFQPTDVEELKRLFEEHPGNTKVVLHGENIEENLLPDTSSVDALSLQVAVEEKVLRTKMVLEIKALTTPEWETVKSVLLKNLILHNSEEPLEPVLKKLLNDLLA